VVRRPRGVREREDAFVRLAVRTDLGRTNRAAGGVDLVIAVEVPAEREALAGGQRRDLDFEEECIDRAGGVRVVIEMDDRALPGRDDGIDHVTGLGGLHAEDGVEVIGGVAAVGPRDRR
jgi:hypothetical protein